MTPRTEYNRPVGPLPWDTNWETYKLGSIEWATVSRGTGIMTTFINAFNERLAGLTTLPGPHPNLDIGFIVGENNFEYFLAGQLGNTFSQDIDSYLGSEDPKYFSDKYYDVFGFVPSKKDFSQTNGLAFLSGNFDLHLLDTLGNGATNTPLTIPKADIGVPYLIADATDLPHHHRSYSMQWWYNFVFAVWNTCSKFLACDLGQTINYTGRASIDHWGREYTGEKANDFHQGNDSGYGVAFPPTLPVFSFRPFPGPLGMRRKYRRRIHSTTEYGQEGWKAQLTRSKEWKATLGSYNQDTGEAFFSYTNLATDYRALSIFQYTGGKWTELPNHPSNEADIIDDYGLPLTGDLFGPWILTDLTKMLNQALVYAAGFTYIAYEGLSAFGLGTGIVADQRVAALRQVDYQPNPRAEKFAWEGDTDFGTNGRQYTGQGPSLPEAIGNINFPGPENQLTVSSPGTFGHTFPHAGLTNFTLQSSFTSNTFNVTIAPHNPPWTDTTSVFFSSWFQLNLASAETYLATPGIRANGPQPSMIFYYYNYGGASLSPNFIYDDLSNTPIGFVEIGRADEGTGFQKFKIGNKLAPPKVLLPSTTQHYGGGRWVIGEPAVILDFRGPNGFKYREGYSGL